MNKDLNHINFNTLLIADEAINIDEYSFNQYMANGRTHKLKGFCTKCEEDGCNVCPTNSDYKLALVSHGASSDDIFQATETSNNNFSGWHNEGVLFLMESPSNDWWGFEELEFNGYKKKPTQQWWWIHDKSAAYSYPNEFAGNRYGTLFNSVVFTFKLANAYITNIVKCGMLNSEGHYIQGRIGEKYESACIYNCIEKILAKEIEVLNPKVIFCFGSGVSNTLRGYWYHDSEPIPIITLPHPSFHWKGFTNEFYRHLYFSIINESLLKANIIREEEAISNYKKFLS